jgi:Holliday junction resolvasome RuvABC ATP-dependent DNA helicase subunit
MNAADEHDGTSAIEAGMAYAGLAELLDGHVTRIETAIQSISAQRELHPASPTPPFVTPLALLGEVPEWEELDTVETSLAVLTLRTHIDLAKRTGQVLDHVLIVGPAGVGKTSFARRIAADLDQMPILLVPPYDHRQLPALLLMLSLASSHRDPGQPPSDNPVVGGALVLDQLDRAPGSDPRFADALTWLLDTGHVWSAELEDGLLPVRDFTVVATVRDTERLPAELLDRFPIRIDLTNSLLDSQILTDALLSEWGADVLDRMSTPEFVALQDLMGGTPRTARRLGRLVARWLEAYDRLPTLEEAAVLVQRDPFSQRDAAYHGYLDVLGHASGRGLSVQEIADRLHVPVADVHRLEQAVVDKDGFVVVDEDGLRFQTEAACDYMLLYSPTIRNMLNDMDES